MFLEGNNKSDEAFSNDFIEYRPVLALDKFKNQISSQKFSLELSIINSIFQFIRYFIFEIFKVAEKLFGFKIYFEFEQSDISSADRKLVHHLITAGVITNINSGISAGIYHDEPRLYQYDGKLGKISLYSDAERQICSYASGTSFDDKSQAFLRMIGESVERFCLDCFRKENLIVATFQKLKSQAIHPLSVMTFSSKQRNQRNNLIINEKNSVFRWTKGYSLRTGKSYWIPAQLVYVSYSRLPEEPMIMIPISTGAAAWTSLEGAIYRGLCEAIERDAFMINYLNQIAAPRFNLEKISHPLIKNLYNTLKHYQLELYLLDITTDIPVPTILAIILDRTNIGPPISIGTSANLNIFRAMEGAILEALKIRISKRRLFDKTPAELKIRPAEITNFDNRKLFWRNADLIKKLDFWFSGPIKEFIDDKVQKEFGDDSQNLKMVLNYLNDLDIESFMVDITIPPVRKASFFVVKTVAPKLQPLYLNENLRYLGGERLYQVPVKMGWRKEPLKEEELNSLPHPFI